MVSSVTGMEWSEGHEWSADILLPEGVHEFKLVVEAGGGTYHWEEGENRSVNVSSG